MNDAYFSINNLSKTYPKKNLKVLKDISFTVKKGQLISFIGPSGCGKSTLFNIISGIETQSTGEIFIKGKNPQNRKGMFGYMTQNPALLSWRNALSNIELGQDILKKNKKKSRIIASALLRQFGLLKFANYYPPTLSGGMKQRIALLRTILFNDNFLLLDEPFGALDQLTRSECQQFLIKLREKINPTILFITHDTREAVLLSDKIYVLSPQPAKIIASFEVKKFKKSNLENKIINLLFKNGKVTS